MTGPRVPWTAFAAASAFFVTLAALLRLYVYPSALVMPLEQARTYRMTASGAQYFDTATLTSHAGVSLLSTTTVSGDAGAGGPDTAVWVEFTSLTTEGGDRIDYHERRTAFDRRTGLAVACCDGYVDDDPAARQEGLAFRLPFRAEPRTYPMYDVLLRTAVPLRYERQERVFGRPAYRYTYTAGPIRIEDVPGQLPGKALGLPKWRAVNVARYAEVTRTIWVEPESGLTVKVREHQRQTLRTPDGVERKVALLADLDMMPEDVADRVADAEAFARWVLLVRDLLPGLFLAAGLALVPVALRRRRRDGRRPGPAGEPAVRPDAETNGDPVAARPGAEAGGEPAAAGADGERK
ncbi:DUF3068 domain-containing protein [Streptosporangium sandarakinum]